MSSEYNSKLIDRLYQSSNEEEAERIEEEMLEIADPVFIFPLLAAYRKFKGASNAHYFVSALNHIESREVLDVMIDIVSDPNVEPLIFTYALESFQKYEYFQPQMVLSAKLILFNFVSEYTNISLENLLEYLSKAGIIIEVDTSLQAVFETDKFDTEERSTSLSYLIKSDSKKWLQFYIDNHSRIVNKSAEIILSKTLMSWKGPLVEQLKEKIATGGGPRAKEIIENSRRKEAKEEEEKEKKELSSHPNSKVIQNIIEMRGKVNILSSTNPNIGFNIFPSRESIYKQLEAATTEAGLRSACLELREFFQDIDKNVGEHGLELDQAAKIIPGLVQQDFNKSINQLHLFLSSKGLIINPDLYGLRSLHKLVALFAHPDAKVDLVSLMERVNIADFYKKEDWVALHRHILELYLTFLEKLHGALDNFSKRPTETGR
ncbi:MAG: hypothetical protein Q7S63_01480 [bacterium]|nr:hypothetical protein [bacterium]